MITEARTTGSVEELPTMMGRHRHRHHGPHGLGIGLTLVLFGGLLVLKEFAVIDPAFPTDRLWPVILVGLGLAHLVSHRGAMHVVVSLLAVFVGVGLLCSHLGYVDFGVHHLWPFLIVLVGLLIIWRGYTHRRRGAPCVSKGESDAVATDVIHRAITMGGGEFKIDSQNFKGGELSAVMAGMQIDMRGAALAEGGARLDLHCVLGGVELLVPAGWRVVSEVTPVLGGVEDRTARATEAPDKRNLLILTGSVVMGGVEVKN
jgi:predicted membrane protein